MSGVAAVLLRLDPLFGVKHCNFEIFDVRKLDQREDFKGKFDVIINCENIEHIIDDRKLMFDMANCLKPGGRILLTTPYYHYVAMNRGDMGPFSMIEDGGHVRRGYLKSMLAELCHESDLMVEEISFCSGFFSQRTTRLLRKLSSLHIIFGWLVILPLRPFIPFLDRFSRYRNYSICLEAYKPRFKTAKPRPDACGT
jgi:SAM-dependent methyltransferase